MYVFVCTRQAKQGQAGAKQGDPPAHRSAVHQRTSIHDRNGRQWKGIFRTWPTACMRRHIHMHMHVHVSMWHSKTKSRPLLFVFGYSIWGSGEDSRQIVLSERRAEWFPLTPRRFILLQVHRLNNFRGTLFCPGHRCFAPWDRGGGVSVSAPRRGNLGGHASGTHTRPLRLIGSQLSSGSL